MPAVPPTPTGADATQKLAAWESWSLGALAAPLSHELNNLAWILKNTGEMLQDHADNQAPVPKEDMDELHQVTERLTALAAHWRHLARRPASRLQRLDLSALLTRVLQTARHLGKLQQIELQWTAPATSTTTSVDERALTFAVLNILSRLGDLARRDQRRVNLEIQLQSSPEALTILLDADRDNPYQTVGAWMLPEGDPPLLQGQAVGQLLEAAGIHSQADAGSRLQITLTVPIHHT